MLVHYWQKSMQILLQIIDKSKKNLLDLGKKSVELYEQTLSLYFTVHYIRYILHIQHI